MKLFTSLFKPLITLSAVLTLAGCSTQATRAGKRDVAIISHNSEKITASATATQKSAQAAQDSAISTGDSVQDAERIARKILARDKALLDSDPSK